MALTPEQIIEAVARYEREYDRYTKLAELVYRRCQEILAKTSVRATVQRRAKAPTSLRKKLESIMLEGDRASRFNAVDDVFASMSDLSGVRIATYVESDRTRVVKEIEQEFAGPNGAENPHIDEKDGKAKSRHYRATHCQVRIPDEELDAASANLKGTSCEVQVCSLLAHVWNEIEHDLTYKPSGGSLDPTEKDLLDQLSNLTEAGDICIRQMLAATDRRLAERTGKFLDVHDFVARMRKDFPNATAFGDNAGQLLDELQRLGLDSPELVRSFLQPQGDSVDKTALALLNRFQSHLSSRGERLFLDAASCDLLLVLLLEKKAADVVAARPAGPGLGRPSRLVLFARRFLDMQDQATSLMPQTS